MSEDMNNGAVSGKEKEERKETRNKVSGKKNKKNQENNDDQLHEANQKISELNDKYLRLYSEFDNYRKRTLREKSELIKTASEDVITSLLPVLDDLERAVEAAGGKEEEATHLEGLKLIYNKFKSILQQKGLEAIESKGQPFDVDYHEAITNIPAPGEEMKGKVMDEIQKGYMLNGKVIRFARVVVGA